MDKRISKLKPLPLALGVLLASAPFSGAIARGTPLGTPPVGTQSQGHVASTPTQATTPTAAPTVAANNPPAVSIPLTLVREDLGNGGRFGYRLGITVSVDGAAPELYLVDSASGGFIIATGTSKNGQGPAWFPNLAQVEKSSAPQAALFNDGGYGYWQRETTTTSIQFYDPTTHAKVADYATPGGMPMSIASAFIADPNDPLVKNDELAGDDVYGDVVTTNNGFTLRRDLTWQATLDAGKPPDEDHFFGNFGTGPFSMGVAGMLTTSGYVIEANGTDTSPGNCGKACMIIGLTPEVRAQFLAVMPWPDSIQSKPLPVSGANGAAPYASTFKYSVTVGGKTTSDTLRNWFDTGSMVGALVSDKLYNALNGAGDVDSSNYIKGGTVVTLTGLRQTANGLESTGIATSMTVSTYDTGDEKSRWLQAFAQGQYAPYAVFGINFFMQNAVMYDLENKAIAYTPFYVTTSSLDTGSGLAVTPDMGPLGLAGVISGSGALNIASGGTANLSAVNTYTGATTIASGGWLALAGPGSIAQSAGVTVDGTFDISRAAQDTNITSLSGAGSVLLGATTLKLRQADGSFDGVIADGGIGGGTGGSLAIEGGKLTLSGANTYTGTTLVAAGASLVLAGSGSVASSAGITVDGSFDLADASNAGTIPLLSGSGNLLVESGTLALSGNNPFTGTTTIDAPATLALDGSLGGSVVALGALSGAGSIGGNLDVEDAITVGGPDAPGSTLNVGGDYRQGQDATYTVHLNGANGGTFSLIDAAGHATLVDGSTVTLAPAPANNYLFHVGADYPILTAAQGVTGNYQLVGNTALSAVLGLTLDGDANHRYFKVTQTRSLASIAGTANQRATLAGVQGLPGASDALAAIASLPDDASIRAAADQVSGEIYAGMSTPLLENSRYLRDTVNDRLRQAGEGAVGPTVQAGRGGLAWWGQVAGAWGRHDGDTGLADVKDNIKGVLLGVDHLIGQHGRLGLTLGSTRTSIDMDERGSSVTSRNLDLGFYGGIQHDTWGLRAGAAWTRHRLSSKRQIAVPGVQGTVAADYDASTAQVFGEAAYRISFRRSALEPYVRAAWVKLQTDAAHEHGSAAALSVEDGSRAVAIATIGLRANTHFALGRNGTLTLHETVGWQHASGDVTADAKLAFDTGAPFTIEGVALADSTLTAGVGLAFNMSRTFSFDLSWQGWFASHARANEFGARFDWRF